MFLLFGYDLWVFLLCCALYISLAFLFKVQAAMICSNLKYGGVSLSPNSKTTSHIAIGKKITSIIKDHFIISINISLVCIFAFFLYSLNFYSHLNSSSIIYGASTRVQTWNLHRRRVMLYPIELWMQVILLL